MAHWIIRTWTDLGLPLDYCRNVLAQDIQLQSALESSTISTGFSLLRTATIVSHPFTSQSKQTCRQRPNHSEDAMTLLPIRSFFHPPPWPSLLLLQSFFYLTAFIKLFTSENIRENICYAEYWCLVIGYCFAAVLVSASLISITFCNSLVLLLLSYNPDLNLYPLLMPHSRLRGLIRFLVLCLMKF